MKLYSFGIFMMGTGFGLLIHNRLINFARKRNYGQVKKMLQIKTK